LLNIASDFVCRVDPLGRPKFNLLNCVKGGQRYPLQAQGDFCATAHFLYKRKSGLFLGVGEDARNVAEHIAARS
jgi:hypothetical protein